MARPPTPATVGGVRRCLSILLLLLGRALAAAPDATNVYAWYRGDAGLQLAADHYSVTAWTNSGTASTTGAAAQVARNLVQITGAPQKSYLVLTNGQPAGAVRFGGEDGLWATKGNFGIITNHRTIIACVRIHSGAGQGFLFDSTSTTPGYTRALTLSNFWQISVSSGLGTRSAPVVTNVWQVHSFVVTTNGGAPVFEHYSGGVLATGVSVGATTYLSGLMIGANVAQQFGLQVDVAEFLVFNNALDAASRSHVEEYLVAKWAGVVADTNAPPLPYVPQPLFVAGQEGYGCYRIPALVTTTQGTIIAVADGRISGCSDIPNPLDLVMKRSFDNGQTWTPLQVIADYGSNPNDTDVYPAYGLTNPIARTCAGDAALLLDRANGRVWVLYDNGAPSGGRAIKLEMRYSDDDGATWSEPVDVEALNTNLRPTRAFAPEFLTGPGNGIQLGEGPNAGRLIFPVYVYGNPYYSAVIYSDDHGATWQRGGIAGTGGGEIQIVEMSNGGLLASLRDNAFSWNGVRTFSRSDDGGLTWGSLYTATTNQPALPDPACQASIIRLTTTNGSNASRILFANAAATSVRTAMTLRISYDEGQTWPVTSLVHSGSSAYSALTRLASDEAGLLFEAANYTRIDFARRSVGQMSGGLDALPPFTAWAGGQFTPAQLANPSFSGPAADPDGDGFSNGDEFRAGTVPTQAASYLATEITAAEGSLPYVHFAAVSGRTYAVEHLADLSSPWLPYTNVQPFASNRIVSVPIGPTNTLQCFRVVLPAAP